MPPDLQDVLLLAAMNPAAIVAGFWFGRRADQIQKLVVAGFAGGIAGVMFAGLLMLTGLHPPHVRLLSGVLVAAGLVGVVAGWLGFASRPNDSYDEEAG